MSEDAGRPSTQQTSASRWFSLRGAVLLALVICALRLLYLLLLSPYELDGDEAQYWEWSRRLELSYYTKGPGIAWTIYVSRIVFGSTEGGVRVPAAICSCITMIALARLAYDLTGRGNKPAFYTAALYTLTPAYLFTSQFMTIDMPYFMFAALAALAAYHAAGRSDRLGGPIAWALLGLALGVGFLYKYTILLMLPGLMIFLVLQRNAIRQRGGLMPRLGVMLATFVIAINPVILWNQQEGWPTVSHLLGHVNMPGGDSGVRKTWSYSPMWTLEGLGTQVGALGAPVAVLLVLAFRWAWRGRRHQAERWPGYLLLILLGLPTLVFYLCVSFLSEIEGNWPLGGYIPLLPLAGAGLAVHMPVFIDRQRRWEALPAPRPWVGWTRRRPQTAWQVCWHIGLWWGVIAAACILFAPYGRHLPGVRELSGFARITGQQQYAEQLHQVREQLTRELGEPPVILAYKYRMTATLAFYLPDRPTTVYCGQHYFGARRSPYDYFSDTDLTDPALSGRNFLLVGLSAEDWARVFRFNTVQTLDRDNRWYLGLEYQGPAESGVVYEHGHAR